MDTQKNVRASQAQAMNPRLSGKVNKALCAAGRSVILGLIAAPAFAQFKGCPVDDFRCIDDLYFLHCAEPGATAESCRALAEDLHDAHTSTPTGAIGVTLGSTYYRLADQADDDVSEGLYLDRARQTFMEVIARDEASADALAGAYVGLRTVDFEGLTPEASLDLLRKAAALNPTRFAIYRFLRELIRQGTPDTYREAVDVTTMKYESAPAGEDKWYFASYAHFVYELANETDLRVFEASAADDFASRVKEDIDWERTAQTLDAPAQEVAGLRQALETACHLLSILGEEPCLRGIESSVRAALSSSDRRQAERLADAAAYAVMVTPGNRGVLSADTRTPWLMDRIDELIAGRLDTLAVMEAVATKSRDRDRRLEAPREIVTRIPNDGHARFSFGKELFDWKDWEDAHEQFLRATELLPDEAQSRVGLKSYLRQTEYQLQNR